MAADPRGKAETLALRRRLLRYRDGGAGRCAHARRTHVRRGARGAQGLQPRASSGLQFPGPPDPAAGSWPPRPPPALRPLPDSGQPLPLGEGLCPGTWEYLPQGWPAPRTWAWPEGDPGRD